VNSQEARKVLETQEKTLCAIQAEHGALTVELEALQSQRSAMVRKLAAGGGSPERKSIIALEQRVIPVALRTEGLEQLLIEAEAAVAKSQENLAAVVAEEQARALAAAAAAEAAECERIRAELPQHERRIFELYRDLCLAVGDYMIAEARIGHVPSLDSAFALRTRLAGMAQAENLAMFSVPGPMQTPIWAMVKVNGGNPQPQPGGYVDFSQYVNWQKAKAREGYLREMTHE
jgi:hypothetical protein